VRSFSVSSLQALAIYNNDFVLNQSAVLAKRVAADAAALHEPASGPGGSPGRTGTSGRDARTTTAAEINRAVQLVWLREPEAAERRALTRFVRDHGLPALCRLLLNSNEFLFVE
jgi:hypothetical protein